MKFSLTESGYAKGMSQALERMLNAITATLESVRDAVLALSLTPLQWGLVGFGVLMAALLFALLLRRPRPDKTPQLLLARGDIAQAENSSLQLLSLKISNLNEYPVQLLELALRTDLMPHPMTIEAIELLPPHQAVDLEAELPSDIVGDQGTVFAYLHTPRRQNTIYRVQANFAWEPWKKRYKLSPLGQTVRPVRNLSSSQQDALRKRSWLERNPHLSSGPGNPHLSSGPSNPHLKSGPTSAAPETAKAEADQDDKKKPVWEFPQEF